MSNIKKLQYTDKEIINEVSNLFNSLNRSFIKNGKLTLDQVVILKENQAKKLLIELKEEDNDYTVISLEFSTPKIDNPEEFEGAKKFHIQIDKAKLEGQVTLYHDYLDSDEDVELIDDYADYRIYEELNLLLTNSIMGYLDEGKVGINKIIDTPDTSDVSTDNNQIF